MLLGWSSEFLDRAVLIFRQTRGWGNWKLENAEIWIFCFFMLYWSLHDLKCVFNSSAEVKSRTEGNESWRPLVTCLLFIGSLLPFSAEMWDEILALRWNFLSHFLVSLNIIHTLACHVPHGFKQSSNFRHETNFLRHYTVGGTLEKCEWSWQNSTVGQRLPLFQQGSKMGLVFLGICPVCVEITLLFKKKSVSLTYLEIFFKFCFYF